jgi:UDP-GlcNAc3NAcA epimerase
LINIVSVVGARPQFIKATLLSKLFHNSKNIREILVHTGQHFDYNMNQLFFNELEIPTPSYHLGVNSLPHGAMTGRILEGVEKILIEEKPDYCLVYGDTNSTIAAAVAAKKLDIFLIHVEAGLRSYNMKMPEEINRILTDRISDILFCPTQKAADNLFREGFDKFNCRIKIAGDIMLDMVEEYSKEETLNKIEIPIDISGDYLFCTIHRQENTDIRILREILKALEIINEETRVILPIHPRTRKIISDNNLKLPFKLVDPLSYLQTLKVLKKSNLVITDSGGLQKESYFLSKPCVTIRNETEWVELIEIGQNVLAGSKSDDILKAYDKMKNKKIIFDNKLFGSGNSRFLIYETILDHYAAT